MVTLWWNWTHCDLLLAVGEKEHSQFLTASMSNSPVIDSVVISPTNEFQLFTDLRYLRIKENYHQSE